MRAIMSWRSSSLHLLYCIATVFAVSRLPALARASKPPLVVYVHEDRVPGTLTSVIATGTGYDFGSIVVTDSPLRTTDAGDSVLLGDLVGLIVAGKDYLFLSLTYVLSSGSGCSGSIQVQGATDLDGNGRVSITGGTGDFLWATGYMDLAFLTKANAADVVYKSVFYLK